MSLSQVKVVRLYHDAIIPQRVSDEAVGYDVYAFHILDRETKEPTESLPAIIEPGDAKLVGIGVVLAIPPGYEAQVRPRSGLANKYDVELSNSPGTVDPDFRGVVGCLLRNRGDKAFTIEPGMRIAQLIFSSVELPELLEVGSIEDLGTTRRGTDGFGSTGNFGSGLGTEEYEQELARLDKYFMGIVLATANLSNCVRGCPRGEDGKYQLDKDGRPIGQTRKYGCVITRGLRPIATGFNAQYPGSLLCAEVGCLREEEGIPSGEQIERCRAIHAEQMAIISAANVGVSVEGATMYVNAEPCRVCARMIAGLGIETLVVLKEGYSSPEGLEIVREAGIRVRTISKSQLGYNN